MRLAMVTALRALRISRHPGARSPRCRTATHAIREEAIGTIVEIYAERDRGGPVDAFLQTFSDEYDRSSVPPYTAVDPTVFRALAGSLKDEKKGSGPSRRTPSASSAGAARSRA